jgi:hypothetical protein
MSHSATKLHSQYETNLKDEFQCLLYMLTLNINCPYEVVKMDVKFNNVYQNLKKQNQQCPGTLTQNFHCEQLSLEIMWQ